MEKGNNGEQLQNAPGLGEEQLQTALGGCFVQQVVWSQSSGEAVIEGIATSFALGTVDKRRSVNERLIFGGILVKGRLWPGHGYPSRCLRRHQSRADAVCLVTFVWAELGFS